MTHRPPFSLEQFMAGVPKYPDQMEADLQILRDAGLLRPEDLERTCRNIERVMGGESPIFAGEKKEAQKNAN